MSTKKCNTCGEYKLLCEFSKWNNGLQSKCKACVNIFNHEYNHTREGMLSIIYNTQVRTSKRRNHPLPVYNKLILQEWLFSHPDFERLYNNWVDSNYNKWLKPSVDRINDYKGYSLDNIQLMTWGENDKKGNAAIKNGINNKQSRAVLQFDLEGNFIKEFYSISQAGRELDIGHGQIGKICRGEYRYKTAGGFKWKYKNALL